MVGIIKYIYRLELKSLKMLGIKVLLLKFVEVNININV